MASTNQDIAARITDVYKGVEGFYVLNSQGDLGYFSSDGQRLVKESFDNHAHEGNPELQETIEAFFMELRHAATNFPPNEDKELGYLLPIDDDTVWRSATLVLHDYVDKDLRDAFDRAIRRGDMTLMEGDRRAGDIEPERGLHRGFEDLLNHVGSFGTHNFFPVLYFRSADKHASNMAEQPLRVLNLLSLIKSVGRFSKLLERMRRNLQERGALNQASRVEHRFKLQDEG